MRVYKQRETQRQTETNRGRQKTKLHTVTETKKHVVLLKRGKGGGGGGGDEEEKGGDRQKIKQKGT